MIRYTYRLVPGNHAAGCSLCGWEAVAICTDRKSGSEFWVCSEHMKNKGKMRRKQLHADFQKSSIFSKDLHKNKPTNAVLKGEQ